ncbi:MAG: SLC13 family permease [Pseudomonadota bacterium]|nr:SLC13 family permease [Pseudomonadota bacterium]
MDALLVGLIALGAVLLFVRERFPPDIVALLVLIALVVFGLVTPHEGISGFSSPATITVGAMFVLSAGLRETGALDAVARFLTRMGRNGPLLQLSTTLVVAAISGFINNTAAVAVFLPVVLTVARRNRVSTSKLLIPLSYASQFGGVCTLIGTSTNLLVNSLVVSAGLSAFGFFDFAPIGLLLVAIGCLYLVTIGWWLLPNRSSHDAAADAYALREYICAMSVAENSRLIGKTLAQGGFGRRGDVVLLELIRDNRRMLYQADLVINVSDVLVLQAAVDDLLEVSRRDGLRLERENATDGVVLEGDGLQLVELIVAPMARAVGRPLAAIESTWIARSTPIAIARRDNVLHTGLTLTPLSAGDALLLLIRGEDMTDLRDDPDFVVLSARDNPVPRRRRAPFAIGVTIAVVILAATKYLPIEIVALLGATSMAIGRCVGIDRLYRYVELRVVVLLAAMLPLGIAMEKTGAASMLVKGAVSLLPANEPIFALALIYALTALLTEAISNNATAVLMTPIAIALGAQLGIRPEPLLVAVAFAASTSFSTPIGYQTNTMVYSAGRYAFKDFLRVGIPLNLLFFGVSVWAIPRWFPF